MWHGCQGAPSARSRRSSARLIFGSAGVAAGVSLSMFKYPTREWLALRDLDGPEQNTLNTLS